MGKPFSEELDSLPATFDWSLKLPLAGIVRAFRALTSLPLLAVGSGGSFTVAHLASALHVYHTKRIAQAMTPLQLIASPADLRDLAVFIPTAGGKNPDVLGGFRHLVSEEPRNLMAWCATPESPLAAAAAKYRFVDFFEFASPCGKDGFLAVNSLLAFSLLLARAYAEALGAGVALPCSFNDLICDQTWMDAQAVDSRCAGLWSRDTLIVLHGPSTLPAAVDLESKFTEAALGSVQTADYRHFAHGRHHWLAKRGRESAVLAIICDDDREVAEATLGLLPSDVPVVRLDVSALRLSRGDSRDGPGFLLDRERRQSEGIRSRRSRGPVVWEGNLSPERLSKHVAGGERRAARRATGHRAKGSHEGRGSVVLRTPGIMARSL